MHEYVRHLHEASLTLAGRLTFDKSLMKDGLVICLYGRLIELTGGVLLLIENGRIAGAHIIFRSFLETYADLINLLNDAAYAEHIFAAHHQKWVKVLQEAQRPNEFLAKIGEHDEAETRLREHKASLDELKKKGIAALNVYQRFELAGLEDVYKSIYRFKSSDAHGNLDALISHHIVQNGEDFSLEFYREPENENFLVELDTIAACLIPTTRRIHERLESDCGNEIEALEEEFSVQRKKLGIE